MTNSEKSILWWAIIGGIALFIVMVGMARAQTFDGPAELPRSVPTTITPTITAVSVPAGTNIQTAVNAAQCGDFLSFTAATWSGLTLPSFPCDPQHWIVIDLGGGKIVLTASNTSVKGGAFVRLQNGEITRTTGTGVVYNLISPGAGAHDLVFDRLYVHGTSTDETVRGMELSNVRSVAVINSRFADFHCLAVKGACGDTQAINFGLDTVAQGGNYLIQGNYLEAAGENILSGGGAASYVPCDISILGNRFNKPDSWNQNDPSYVPVNREPWIVKNLLELKNGCRVLVDGNDMRGAWGGFSQTGFAILLTPKNQNNLCPICAVTDITIRHNTIKHTAQAFTFGCGASDVGGWPADCGRWMLHDNSFSDLQFSTCGNPCGQFLIEIASGYGGPAGSPVLHDFTVTTNTFDLDSWIRPTNCPSCGHGFLLLAGPPPGSFMQITNAQFTNNVVFSGNYPIFGTGGAGANCATAVSSNYSLLIPNCWTGKSAFSGNVILTAGAPARIGLANWPAGNHILTAGQSVNGN